MLSMASGTCRPHLLLVRRSPGRGIINHDPSSQRPGKQRHRRRKGRSISIIPTHLTSLDPFSDTIVLISSRYIRIPQSLYFFWARNEGIIICLCSSLLEEGQGNGTWHGVLTFFLGEVVL